MNDSKTQQKATKNGYNNQFLNISLYGLIHRVNKRFRQNRITVANGMNYVGIATDKNDVSKATLQWVLSMWLKITGFSLLWI